MRRGLVLLILLAAPATTLSAWQPPPPPSDPRNATWIEEGVLALGGGHIGPSEVQYLKSQGFGAVANFRSERPDDVAAIKAAGMEHLYIPIDHAVDMNATQLREFVEWANEMEKEGRPMYIHCTNGWHRAAAFAAAWLMSRTDEPDADEQFRSIERIRPGSVMRAPSALLAYQAQLEGEKPLVVLLKSPLARPERNGTMPVEVEVLASGHPAAGAKVHVWSEESQMDAWGRTDEAGIFRFTYVAKLKQGMDHLYARAWHDGYTSGADDVELFYDVPVPTSRPLDIETWEGPHGIEVQVLRNGKPHPARVVAWTTDGWFVFDETGSGQLTLPYPREGAEIHVRAESWGATGDAVRLRPPSLRGEERASFDLGPREDVWVQAPRTIEREDVPANVTVNGQSPAKPAATSALALAAGGVAALAGVALAVRAFRRPTR